MDPRLAMLAQRILGMGNPPVASGATNFDPSGQRGAPMGPPAPQPDPRPFFPRSPTAPPPMPVQQSGPITDLQARGLAPAKLNTAAATMQVDPNEQAKYQRMVDFARQKLALNSLFNVGPRSGIVVHTPAGVQTIGAQPMVRDDTLKESAEQDLDIMSPDERAYIKQQVPEANIPDGMTRTQFRGGPYGKMLQNDYGWDKFMIGEQNKDARLDKSIASREGIASESRDLRERLGLNLLEFRKLQYDLAQQRETRVDKQQEYGRRKESVRAFMAQDHVKKWISSMEGAKLALQMLRHPNSASDRMLGTNIIRTMGEVGTLSTFDVKRADNRLGLWNNIQDYISKVGTGYMSASQRMDLIDMMETLRDAMDEELSVGINNWEQSAEDLQAGLGDSVGTALRSATGQSPVPASQAPAAAQSGGTGMVRMYDPKRKVWGSVPAAQVEAAKAKGLQTEEELNASR